VRETALVTLCALALLALALGMASHLLPSCVPMATGTGELCEGFVPGGF
jgi:hypothetical protein